jgi:hypothetical protein
MRHLETTPLEGFNSTSIDKPADFIVELPDGRELSYDELIAHTPAVTSSYDAFNSPQLVIGSDQGLPHWDESAHYPVGRLDDIHGRTLEVLADSVAIKDEFDNIYASLNIKGCDLSDPHFFKTLTAAREYIIHGLQESIVMERVIRASKLLRQNGVGTEYICGLVIPESFPLDTRKENVGIDDKQPVPLPKLLEHMAGQLAHHLPATDREETREPLEIKLDIIERFSDCNYLITYRAMDCPIRLGELHDPEKFKSFQAFTKQIFKDNDVSKFIQERSAAEYIGRPLAYWLGTNIGRMHKTGIYHKHPVALNITALGSIIDLDSCEGEPLELGDRPINRQDELIDVSQAIKALQEEIDFIEIDDHDLYARLDSDIQQHHAGGLFLRGYLESRFESRKEKVSFLVDFLQSTDPETRQENGMALYRKVEQTYDIYREFSRSFVPSYKMDFYDKLGPPAFNRSGLSVSSIPPNLFHEMKEKIMDPDWTMNSQREELKNEKKPIYNSIKGLVKNLALEHIFSNFEVDSGRSADELLFLGGAALERIKARGPERIKAVEQAQRFFEKQVELVVDYLADASKITVGQELAPLLQGPLKGFEGRIGSIDITVENEPPIDIIYLKDSAEYEKVFKAIGVNDNTSVSTINYGTLKTLIRGEKLLFADSVLIADYAVAHINSEKINKDSLLESLFKYRPKNMPLLMICKVSSGKPKIFIYPTFRMEGETQPHNYQELLDALSSPTPSRPGKNKSHEQLFNIGELDKAEA